MLIRKIQIKDAEAFFEMLSELDKETEFMMYEPDERIKDLKQLEGLIRTAEQGTDLLLAAEEKGQIVGFLSAQRGIPKRIRHTAYIVTGIRLSYRGKGIGSSFFKELDKWAANNNITRLELTVMCHNTIAKRLYEKNGFQVEGIKKNSMFMDGHYVDEFYMAKITESFHI